MTNTINLKKKTRKGPSSLLYACLVCLLLLSSYFATAATYHVKPTGNDGNTGLDWANAYATVQQALSSASSGDEIWVAAGTYYPTTGTDRTIFFIMKPGVAIYGGFPATGTPTMGDRDWDLHLTILSGDIGTPGDNTDNSYHVIFNDFNSLDATAILDGFTITGGNADSSYPDDSGGGMYNLFSSPSVSNSTFSENSANDGGGMFNDYSSPTVSNSTFSENSATDNGGGMNNAYYSSPTIEDTEFNENSANTDGGGMYNDNESSPTVSNSTFSNNSADYGGGMYNVALSSPAVSNSIFNENTADNGGGMYNLLYSSPTIENTTFSENSANTDGGGMYNVALSSPSVSNSTFSENSAGTGGGMYNDNSSPTIENTAFNENSADYGGGMYNYESSPSVSNSTFSDNAANFDGGGMNNVALSSPMIEDTEFSENSAIYGGGMLNEFSSPIVSNSTFSNNSASGGGGMYNTNSSPAVTNSTFNENTADYGGGMLNFSSSPTIENTEFSENSANTDGGGMYNDNESSPTVSNSTFSDNLASNAGGGMHNSISSSPMIENSEFNDNSATNFGGGMFNNSSSSPTVSNTTFSDNTANAGGGMFNNSSSSPTVSNITFSDNTANYGGGMYNSSSSPAVEITTFSDNTANEGGGMYNHFYSSPTVSNTTFSKNTADYGGGMFNDYFSSPTVSNTTFSENSATDYGGGMLNNSSSSPMVSNTAFNENTAGEGGGMYNYSSSPAVEITTFSDNTANYGGGMYNFYYSFPTVSNTTFSKNTADNGGGMFNDFYSPPTVSNSTFSDNSAASRGNGMYNSNSSSTITNSILWDDESGSEIFNIGSTPTITYSIVRDGYAGTGNKDEDPRFVDAEAGDLHLLACSPAIDAGLDASAPALDKDGNSRYDAIAGGMESDMGAFEFQAGGSDDGCNEPPIAACKNITVNANVNCQGTAVATDFNNGSSDPDGDGLTFTLSDDGPYGLGDTDVILTVSDGELSSTCAATITVVDNTPPSANCPGDITVDNDPGQCGAAVSFNIDVSDNCPGSTVSANPPSGSFFPVGTTTVTVTATDAVGNMDECTFDVIVNDVEAPVFDLACQVDLTFVTEDGNVCPADAIISLSEGDEIDVFTGWIVGGIPISPLQGCVDDNCTDASDLTITVDDIAVVDDGSCSRIITITFIADDGNGNFSDPFVNNYTFIDDTAPVFDLACQVDQIYFTEDGNVCPADATISLSEGDEIDVFTGWTVGGIAIPSLQGCVGDNCTAEADLTITVDDITIVDDGTCGRNIAVTFIADDGCGNNSEPFTLNYTFTDDTAPVFDLECQVDQTYFTEDDNVCPADATISLSEGDEIDVFTGWTVGGIAIPSLQGCVGDNCTDEGDLTITVDDITVTDDGTCSRNIAITFIADDGCGNDSEPFVCNYTFIDNTAPVVSFNGILDGGTYVVECDLSSGTSDPLIDIGELTITDNCSAIDFAGITEVLTQLYDGPCVGNLLTRWQQVFTVQDVCGNETVYTLFTEIIDTTPPAFTSSPADVTIECDETAPVPEMEAFDSCSEVIYNFNEVRTDGDCPNNYTLTRTWLASDGCGNTSVETQIVTVEDTTPPVIEFVDEYVNAYTPGQDVFIECSEYGNISLIIASAAAAFDNCSGGVPTFYDLQDLGGFDCAEYGYSGHLISTWKAADECGNESVATINWFLVDETAPVFQGLPADACASLDNLPPVADVQTVDDCELATLTFSQSDPIDCDGGQYIERTWNAEDACGNTNSYTQRISLNGTSGPTITIDYPEIGDVMDGDLVQLPIDCDQDIAFSVADLEAAISVGSGCGSGESSIELNLMDEGDCLEDGYFARYRLSVTATDACGNTASLGIMIDFVDMAPPVVSSPNELTLNCGEDIPMIEATDACGEIASMTFVDSAPIEVSCSANPVAYDRTWTVTDACGNAMTFTQSIIVLDNDGPVFSGVPADMCNNTGIDVVVTVVDDCTGNQAQVFLEEVMSSESGCGEVLTRTWTATDACGNTSVATQQVFFDDEVAPEIEFTSDLVFGLESGDELFLNVGDGFGDPSDPLLLTADDVTVTDNCATITAEVLVESTTSGDCAADGFIAQYDYKFIATDPCGNTSSAAITVFYVDSNAPDFFNVPADTEVFCAAVPAVANVTASDDYDDEVEVIFSETQTATPDGILITRTWTATDKCGNTNAVSQEILVVNNDIDATFSFGSPVIECNSDNNRLGVTPTGGTPPYSYEWQLTFPLEDGYITTDPTLPGILFTMGYITQTFTVIITDANGCEYAASVTVVCDFSGEEGDFTGNGNNGAIKLNVYPNPATDLIKIKAAGLAETQVKVSVYSLLGQVVYQETYEQWPLEGMVLDTRAYPEGTYVLRLETQGVEPMVQEFVVFH